MPRWKIIGLSLLCLIAGAFIGWQGRIWYIAHSTSVLQLRESSSEYKFIKPLLLTNIVRESPQFAGLKEKITSYVAAATGRGEATDISVYFHDLSSGRWTGVNETQLYDPSSMLKVGVMMGYLKSASANPDVLTRHFTYKPEVDLGQHYPPPANLPAGSYTTKQLLERMIIDSDNVPLSILFSSGRQSLVDVLRNLEIPPPASDAPLDFMSPQLYSKMLRTLYNSTYLPRGLSEYALQLLSLTTFKAGLVAGVPKDVVVAHKFGEHTTTDSVGTVLSHQLHDCGIVYYPAQPYLLCVMTRGQDFSALEKVISDISRLTYQDISASN
jgi:beta-lactamase class A